METKYVSTTTITTITTTRSVDAVEALIKLYREVTPTSRDEYEELRFLIGHLASLIDASSELHLRAA